MEPRKELSDLQSGDVVLLCTNDTRYPDKRMYVKGVGRKWIFLEDDYPRAKYSIETGCCNDERPGYYIKIIPREEEVEFDRTVCYLIEEVLPRYLYTLDLSKLKYLQRRWTKKILDNDGKNNSTV